MNKFSLRLILFSILFVVMSGAVFRNHVSAHSMATSAATDTDPHMSMTELRPLQPGDQARADAILAAAKKAAERYRDYRKAQAEGYTIFMPKQQQDVYHFIRESPHSDDKERFDPDQPPALLYTKIDGPRPQVPACGRHVHGALQCDGGGTERAHPAFDRAMACAPQCMCSAAVRRT